MYREEKPFCSTECRCRNIVMDERKEMYCGSAASRSATAADISNSPCKAFWVTPAGTEISHRKKPVTMEAINGAIATMAVGVLVGGSGFSGTDTGEAAAEALMVSSFLGILVSLRGEKGAENVGFWREKERCTAGDLWLLWRFNDDDCLGSDRKLRRKEAMGGRDAKRWHFECK